MTEPSPAALGGDVPGEKWRRELDALTGVPTRDRHERISALLDDLDAQVGSL